MNKLGTSLVIVGIAATLALPGCASNDAPGEEATSAAGASLSTSAMGRSQVSTGEDFVRGGGQPLTSGGDTPGDGTTLYRCPQLVLSPSPTMTSISEYMSFNSGQPNYEQAPIDKLDVGQTRAQMQYSKMVGSWFSANEIRCGVGIVVSGQGRQSSASVNYKKTFAPEKLCQWYRVPGTTELAFLCKDGPSPI